jgi:hypothetical protein
MYQTCTKGKILISPYFKKNLVGQIATSILMSHAYTIVVKKVAPLN